jgi:predicted phage baseplate assembly protein
VDPETLAVDVYEDRLGYLRWQRVDDLVARGRDERCYALDAEAGTLEFGDSLAGKRPAPGARVRLAFMRAGGGVAGNLPAGTLAVVQRAGLVCGQPAATAGGVEAESLEAAERRARAELRHRDRCVTEADYRELAFELDVARVEVMPRFRPFQRRFDSPGVVSVLVIPPKAAIQAPNPRPDRRLVERMKTHLARRAPISTELYVIGPEYLRIGVAVAISIREGFAREEVVRNVRQSIGNLLWPLAPGGRDGAGWPLGQALINLEIEVIAARVPGVLTTRGVSLFTLQEDGFRLASSQSAAGAVRIPLEQWQLPETMQVDVAVDAAGAPTAMEDRTGLAGGVSAVAIPVVPEVC